MKWLVITVVCCQLPALEGFVCPPILAPTDGSVTFSDGRNIYSAARFSCNAGFSLVQGDKVRVCRVNSAQDAGVWDRESPICLDLDCPPILAPTHGSVTFSDGRNIYSRARFSCNAGSSFVQGHRVSVCRVNSAEDAGVWDRESPTCTAAALAPTTPPTISVATTPSSTPSTTPLGSTTPYRPSTDATENHPTPIPTNYNNPTSQTASSTRPRDGNIDRQLSCSCTCDNNQVIVPAAILSVIVLILIVLLVVSFCYNVRLRRTLKGTKTDRVDDFSDMDKSVYYNTAMGQAAMTVPGTQKATNDNCEYEDVSGNKDTIHQDNTGSNVSPAEPQDSSYEAMQRQADYSNSPPLPAIYQELGALGNK